MRILKATAVSAFLGLTLGLGTGSVAAAQVACLGETEEVAIREVADPRTVALGDGRLLRLAGIESAALLSGDGSRSEAAMHQRLRTLVTGAPLGIAWISKTPDRYGRLPAMIVAGSEIVQETLVREGLAIAFGTGNSPPCFNRLLAAEEAARRERRGVWAEAWVAGSVPEALQPRIGRFAILEGRVHSVGNRRMRTYLNFGSWWREDVTVEIAATDREAFGGEEALAALAGKKVRVRGYLAEHDGPLMLLRSSTQIELLEDVVDGAGIAP